MNIAKVKNDIFIGNDLQVWHSSGRLRCHESDGREYSGESKFYKAADS